MRQDLAKKERALRLALAERSELEEEKEKQKRTEVALKQKHVTLKEAEVEMARKDVEVASAELRNITLCGADDLPQSEVEVRSLRSRAFDEVAGLR